MIGDDDEYDEIVCGDRPVPPDLRRLLKMPDHDWALIGRARRHLAQQRALVEMVIVEGGASSSLVNDDFTGVRGRR